MSEDAKWESATSQHFDHRSGAHIIKPPTGEELRIIKAATELYRSTSFKLQIDALLPNVRPKYHLTQPLDSFLLSLHTCLMNIPSTPPQHPLHASRCLSQSGIAVPYIWPLPTEDTNWKVAFEPPSEIILVGSWATKTAVKAKDNSKYEIDVAVAMPPSLFQEKDYLNGRIFQKRAYYLSIIASSVVGNETLHCDVFFQSNSGDPRYTTLVLRPYESIEGVSKLNAQVRIIPFLPNSPIPLQRMSPSRSNVRTSEEDHIKEEPTRLYNTAFLHTTVPKAHLLAVHALKQDVPAFSDALTLLRVWAHQRGYGTGSRLCVRGFEGKGLWWASLIDMLVHGEEPQPMALRKASTKRKPLGRGLSSYQLFRAALDFLSRHNFVEHPVFVKSKEGHRFSPMDYASHEAVFVDSTSSINLLAGVPLSSLDMLRYDAQATIDVLDRSGMSEDAFQTVFLQDHRDLISRFDVVLRVDVSSASMRNSSTHMVADHGSLYNAILATLTSTLRRGLGNRAKAIAVLHPSSGVRPLSQALPANPSVLHIGVILDTENAFRLVDHGPPVEDQESEQEKLFREFWGEKAELRRFKDGSITESIVWDVKSAEERSYIPSLVITHLLRRHLGIRTEDIRTWQNEFDALLKVPESIRSLYEERRAAVGFKAALTAFDSLVKQIKALDDQLPLAILNVSPASPALRYTEVFAPAAVELSLRTGIPVSASYLPAMEIIVEFEKSAKWPDDLCAIQKVKLAFFERLATALMVAVKGLHASAVFCSKHTLREEIRDQSALDIVTPDGWAFRARILHDREVTLLDRIIDGQSHIPKALRRNLTGEEAFKRQAALEARQVYLRRFIHAPRHHRAIAALSHKFSAFAGTVRLTKRWFSSHWLLCSHVSEEAVELICAYIFLRLGAGVTAETAAPLGVPGMNVRGFAEVIRFLQDWDWSKRLVIPLDFSDVETTSTDSFSGTSAWSLVTQCDMSGHMWTSSGPNAIVARRITTIAKATWEALAQSDSHDFNAKLSFQHPLEHYDFLAEVNPAVLPRYYQNIEPNPSIWTIKGKYANARLTNSSLPVLPGYDPAAALFRDLAAVYEESALFFYDVFGGTRMGGAWLPTLKNARPFRVLGAYSSVPVSKDDHNDHQKGKGLVTLNELSLTMEVKRIGSGLITGIVLQVD